MENFELSEAVRRVVGDNPVLQQAIDNEPNAWAPDEMPEMFKLAVVGRLMVRGPEALPPVERARILIAIEGLARSDNESVRAAALTGFMDEVVGGIDANPELWSLTRLMGPQSRAYFDAWTTTGPDHGANEVNR